MASRQRVIIALDLDAFYVAASRKRDPSLVGLPVGIKQKNILATCSYEARRRGVAKLDGVRDALTKCPELVLVDGEDLSYFRDVSRQVFRLVTRFLKGVSVERLGMDELFCDVTDFLDEWAGPAAADDDSFVGNLLPSNAAATPPWGSHAAKLRRASHLALEVRSLVSQQINLTCSAGIASSKLVAKMAGNVHKPNQQTVFAPLDETADEAVRLFLDPYPLRQINGFGSSIVRQLCDSITDPHSPSPSTIDAPQLTVALARQVFDREKLVGLFGARTGNRLWQLVLGLDDEPVQPSPEIPAQISIEDTYRVPLHTDSAVKAQILTLSTSLLRRLETELRVSDSDDDSVPALPELVPYEKPLDEWIDRGIQATIRDYHRVTSSQELLAATAAGQQPFEWKRFPLSLRLSISQKKFVRVSRQTRMPVDIFDTAVPRPQRALVLAASVQALFRTIVNAKEDFALRLINIAATDLVAKRPARGIGDFLQKQLPLASQSAPSGDGGGMGDDDGMVDAPADHGEEAAKSTTRAADPSVANGQGSSSQERIDADVFRQLPPDLQAELAAHYGLDPSMLVPLSEDEEQQREAKEEVAAEEVKGKQREGKDALVCPLCAQPMLPYLQHDHARWPLRGLPMEEWLDHDDEEEQDEEQEGDWQDLSELE